MDTQIYSDGMTRPSKPCTFGASNNTSERPSSPATAIATTRNLPKRLSELMTNFLASDGLDPAISAEVADIRDGASQENATAAARLGTKQETASVERKTIIGNHAEHTIDHAIRELDPQTRMIWLRQNPSLEAYFSLEEFTEFYFCATHGIFNLWPQDTLQCTAPCMWRKRIDDWFKNRANDDANADRGTKMAGDERIWAAMHNPSEPYESDVSSSY